jgi:ribosomal protein L44E
MQNRNPRRAYNKDGSMAQPATVGSDSRYGHTRAEIWCNDCLHHAEISMEGLPDDLPIPDICLRYRCSKCGSKNLMSRGSIHEHYELNASKGLAR